jgi:uncharacterized coiled-coil DUF342 family protein
MKEYPKLQIPIEDIEELADSLSRKMYNAVSTFELSDAYDELDELRELVNASDLPDEELVEFSDIVDEVQEAFDEIASILKRLSY